MSKKETNRRDFLFTATYAVGAVGVGATIWPMIDQMNPDASVKALASTEVDVSAVNPENNNGIMERKTSFYPGSEEELLKKSQRQNL